MKVSVHASRHLTSQTSVEDWEGDWKKRKEIRKINGVFIMKINNYYKINEINSIYLQISQFDSFNL